MEKDDSQEPFDRLAALHQDKFKEAHYEALNDVHTHYENTSHLYRPGEKATLMHVHVRDRVKRKFTGVRGVKIDDRPGRAFKVQLDGAPYGIEAKAEFKCKKIDARLLTANIRTVAVNRFEKGLPELKRERRPHVQPPLSEEWRAPETTGGIEPGHGNAGYIINALWTGFEKLCLTYYIGPRKARLAVDIPLDNDGGSVVALPLADITEVSPRKRVKPRKKKEEVAKPDARPKRRIKLEAAEPVEEKRKKARNNGEDS